MCLPAARPAPGLLTSAGGLVVEGSWCKFGAKRRSLMVEDFQYTFAGFFILIQYQFETGKENVMAFKKLVDVLTNSKIS